MPWSAPILERGTGTHPPLLKIHLESHTARFRNCTMAMIYLASASISMAQFEASPSLRVLFEQVDVFCTGSIFRYCAAVRISRFVSKCDQIVPWDSGGLVNSARILRPGALAAIVSSFHKQGIKARQASSHILPSNIQFMFQPKQPITVWLDILPPDTRRSLIINAFLSSEYIGQSIPTTQIPLIVDVLSGPWRVSDFLLLQFSPI
jgi:hypothetical protein